MISHEGLKSLSVFDPGHTSINFVIYYHNPNKYRFDANTSSFKALELVHALKQHLSGIYIAEIILQLIADRYQKSLPTLHQLA